jgi:hypothetical protein
MKLTACKSHSVVRSSFPDSRTLPNVASDEPEQLGKCNRIDAVRRLPPFAEVVIVHEVDDESRTLQHLAASQALDPPLERGKVQSPSHALHVLRIG